MHRAAGATSLLAAEQCPATLLCPGVGGDGDREDDTGIVVHALYPSNKKVFYKSLFN